MIAWLAGKALDILGGKVIGGLVDGYKAQLAAGTSKDKLTADLALREMGVQARELEAQKEIRIAQIGRWYTPENLFCYIMVVYFGKCIIWDKVLSDITHGSTDALGGDIASWAAMIMIFLFGKRGFENIARILRR